MNLAKGPVQRPVLTAMIFLVIITLGIISFSRLSVDLMPEITYPTLNVSTSYQNTGPEEMEQLITRPIEEAMSAVPGVEEVYSISSEGSSTVRVMFSWGTNLDAAADDVRERLDRVIPRLPEDANRPMLRKFDPAQFPILILGALSNLDPVQMRRIIDEQISYRIERVPSTSIRTGLKPWVFPLTWSSVKSGRRILICRRESLKGVTMRFLSGFPVFIPTWRKSETQS